MNVSKEIYHIFVMKRQWFYSAFNFTCIFCKDGYWKVYPKYLYIFTKHFTKYRFHLLIPLYNTMLKLLAVLIKRHVSINKM